MSLPSRRGFPVLDLRCETLRHRAFVLLVVFLHFCFVSNPPQLVYKWSLTPSAPRPRSVVYVYSSSSSNLPSFFCFARISFTKTVGDSFCCVPPVGNLWSTTFRALPLGPPPRRSRFFPELTSIHFCQQSVCIWNIPFQSAITAFFFPPPQCAFSPENLQENFLSIRL